MSVTKQKELAAIWIVQVAKAAGGLVVLLGAVVIFGWFTDSALLVQLQPQWVPMQFNTALGFVLCGAGLLFLIYFRDENRRRLAMTCGGLALGIGLLTLLEYSFGLDLGIDQLFMEPAITTKTEDPGRMAPVTALTYLLSGIVVLMLAGSWRPRFYTLMARLLGMSVLSLGLGNLLGYAVGGETPYGWSHPTYMAVHTAGGFMLFGVGLLSFIWRPMMDPGQGKSHSLALESAIGLAILALVLWQSLLAQERLQTAQMVTNQTANLSAEIGNNINHQILALVRMAQRWEDRGGTPEVEWRRDAARYIADQPGLQAIEWVDASYHVRWIEPLAGNEAAKGLDLGFEPRRRAALKTARKQRQIILTRPIDLVQGGKGFLVYVPLYSDGVFGGFILGVYRTPDLIDSIRADIADMTDYRIRIFDGDEEIYTHDRGNGYDEAWEQETNISLYNQRWQLHLTPSLGLLAATRSSLPTVTLGGGLLLALFLGLAVNRGHVARQQAIALAESELWQRGIFDSLEEGVLVVGPERVITDMNPACQYILGYSWEEIAGQSTEMLHVDHEHYVEFGERLKVAFDQGEAAHFEYEAKRKNGEVFPSEHTVSLLKSGSGEVIGIVSVIRDITVRKQTEETMRSIAAGVSAQTGDAFFKTLVVHLAKLFDAECVLVSLLVEQKQDRAETIALCIHGEIVANMSYELAHTPCEHVVGGGCNIIHAFPRDIQKLFPDDEMLVEMDAQSYIGAPLLNSSGRPIGLIAVMDNKPIENTEQTETILEIFVARAAAEIERLLAEEELKHHREHLEELVQEQTRELGITNVHLEEEIAEHQRAEEVLAEREQYLRTMFENMQEGVITTDEAGIIESANPAVLAMFGYDSEQLLGKNEIMLMRGQDRELHTRALKRFLEQNTNKQKQSVVGDGHREVTAVRADGSEFQMSLALDEMWLTGKRRFIAIIRDVTESRMAQQALEDSQAQLRQLTDHLQTVREAERAGIAREIHDELGQALLALNFDLQWLNKRVTDTDKDKRLSEKLRSMLQLVNSTVDTVQRISSELRPSLLKDLGLEAAIHWYVEEYQDRTSIKCNTCIDLDGVELDMKFSTAVFRVVQEALTNVGRHSGANEVSISLVATHQGLLLEITDNGRGVDEQEISDSASFGLMGMRERAMALGGSFDIKGVKNDGTTIRLTLPINEHEAMEI